MHDKAAGWADGARARPRLQLPRPPFEAGGISELKWAPCCTCRLLQAARIVQRAAVRLGRTLAATEALAAAGDGALPSLSPLDEELSQLLETIIGADPTSLAAIEAPALARRAAAAARQRQHDQPPLLPPHRMPPSCAAAFPQPPDCAFLRPGQQFEGRQRVAAHHLGPAKQVRICACGLWHHSVRPCMHAALCLLVACMQSSLLLMFLLCCSVRCRSFGL